MLSSNHTFQMFALPGVKTSNRISILQRKAMRIIFFSDFNKHTTPLFSKAKILKFIDFDPFNSFLNLLI